MFTRIPSESHIHYEPYMSESHLPSDQTKRKQKPQLYFKAPSVTTFMHLHRWKCSRHKSIRVSVDKRVWRGFRPTVQAILAKVPNAAIRQLIESLHCGQYKGTKEECRQAIYNYLCSIYDTCTGDDSDDDFMDDVSDALIIYLPRLFQ